MASNNTTSSSAVPQANPASEDYGSDSIRAFEDYGWDSIIRAFEDYGWDSIRAFEDYGWDSIRASKHSESHSIPIGLMLSGVVENHARRHLLPLLKAIYGISGGLADVKKFIDNPSPVNAKIANNQNVVCAAVSVGDTKIVEVLLNNLSVEDLQVTNKVRREAMRYAASYGYTQIAKCLYEKDKNLVTFLDGRGICPVVIACNAGNIDTTRYLYSVTPPVFLLSDNGIQGAELLCSCIGNNNMFDIALHLIRKEPKLALATGIRDITPIFALSCFPSLFRSGSRLSFWEGWIYSCLKVKQSAVSNGDFSYTSGREKSKGENIIPKAIKRIYNLKKSHGNALEFLVEVCQYTSKVDYEQLVKGKVNLAVFSAAKHGNPEFIIEIFKANPDLISLKNKDGTDIFMVATQHRQEKVFSLVYGFDTKKARLSAFADFSGNSLLHLAANLGDEAEAKLTQISGAALKMQRELQWFKGMENILPESDKRHKNKDKETAKQVFDKTHKDLAKEGQEWMKKIASSSTVVGTLIMTIMFAAAFTVPGGYDQNIGFPIFLTSGHGQYYEHALMIFIISVAISLFTSSTSVLMFLGILTSRYAMEDFLKSLPNKLIIALSTLFISIATMMVAFCAGLIIMLEGRLWITIPIIFLATIPITLFAWLQFPLLVKIFISTYGAGIFDRQTKFLT